MSILGQVIMSHLSKYLLCFSVFMTVAVYANQDSLPSETIIGRVERIKIAGVASKLSARIDTGAKTTSINAKIITINEDKDKKNSFVTFEFIDDEGVATKLQRPLVGWVEIKQTNSKAGGQRRPVVAIDICIADEIIQGRADLADREFMEYPVLIGRNYLEKGSFLVNPRKSFLQQAICK
jgi:hypothetical protein